MEVKIGVLHNPRELTLESNQTQEEIETAVSAAVSSGSAVRLVDAKGSVLLVPAGNLAYIEIGVPRRGGVGFGAL